MRKIDNCYFATTPYQIISVISLARKIAGTADLYIFTQFSTAREVADKIRKLALFEKVKVCENDKTYGRHVTKFKSRFMRFMYMIWDMFHAKEVAADIFEEDVVYDRMFVSVMNEYYRILQYSLKEHGTIINVFDDGMGSYCSDRIILPRFEDRALQKMFFHRNLFKEAIKYLYSPYLYRLANKDEWEIIPIENIFNGPETRQMIVDIFGSCPIERKVLIVDTINEEVLYDENEVRKLEGLYRYAIDKFGLENVAVKSHPRDKKPQIEGLAYLPQTVPMEAILAQNDLSDKILLTINSTASLNPKIMFDQEPTVILLDKILKKKTEMSEKFSIYMNGIRDLYRDKDRFNMITSEQQYYTLIDQLSEKQ